MEHYRFILKNAQGQGIDYICKILPENVEGFRVTKKFRHIIPVGYLTNASDSTMRLMGKDADLLRNYFFQNGINGFMRCELQRLNKLATGYDTFLTGEVDFETMIVRNTTVELGITISSEQKDYEKTLKTDITIYPK